MSSEPRNVRRGSNPSQFGGSPSASLSHSRTRHASTARLSSPVPSHLRSNSLSQQEPISTNKDVNQQNELAARPETGSLQGPGQSALSSALASDLQREESMQNVNGSRKREGSFAAQNGTERHPRSNYGSLDVRHIAASPAPIEDPEIVKRHLVQPDEIRARIGSPLRPPARFAGVDDDEEFSSLQLQGGDMTREVYKWAEDAEGSLRGRAKRTQSFHANRPEPENETLDIQSIRQPGGFRRNYLRRVAGSPAPSGQLSQHDRMDDRLEAQAHQRGQPKLFTNSFLEFLTLYGHFAGEDLEEDDEVLEPDEYFSSDAYTDGDDEREPGEDSALLTPGTPGKRRRRPKERTVTGNNSSFNVVLLLLKSFVGTGVLFLPRAFLNGGMLFSCLVLLGVALLSFYCFILLVNTRLRVEASFGDIGGILYGKWMRAAILFSIVLSQVGFVSAYIVFTSESLQAFVSAVSKCKSFIDIKYMVMMQLIIFLPLSLIRDIGKLGFTALIADAFILLGLIYLYYYDIFEMVRIGGVSDIELFNPSSWTLFIGTAIFTFEGVGLIIPIQETMRKPEKFPRVLGLVMVIVTVLMISIGAMSYAAFGSHTKTVVILNLPQDSKFVNAVQFLYSLAILLSTPLQLFPAIRILENELFTRSGKYNPFIKWKKNVFRFVLVVICALIAWGGAGDLDKFVSLVGSFACVPLVYVYPPLLHLKAVSKTRRQRIADYVLCIFGVAVCAYTTALTIKQWSQGSVKSPGYCDS